MNTAIGVYEDHDMALEAVLKLKEAGFAVKQLSIMGLTEQEVVDDEMHVMAKNPLKPAGLGVGVALGTAVGLLTGIGIFAIPGLGLLYGAGAVVGAIAGFDFGLIGGGVATVLATLGVKDDIGKKYHNLLLAGKFLVVAHGSAEEVANAKDTLHHHGKHSELDHH